MGILYILLAMMMWSLVGTFVKISLHMVDSTTVTFARFFFGVIFLGIFLLIKDKKILLRANLSWIWIGALGKACNYFFENIGLHNGYSYSNVLVSPFQTVILLLMTIFYFKEKVTPLSWVAAWLCVLGVLVISWNGLPLDKLFAVNGLSTLCFAIAGVGSALHVVSQKVLVKSMDPANMNFTVFFWASLLMLVPVPFNFEWSGTLEAPATIALIVLGLITGLSFYLFSIALQKVSFLVVVLVTNATPLFMILWGKLFFNDPVTLYVVSGTALFFAGIFLLNLPYLTAKRVKVNK
jgi:drug/metabolite transporter (DMT)-like permease